MNRENIVSRILSLKKFVLEGRETGVKRTMFELDKEKGNLNYLEKIFKEAVNAFQQTKGVGKPGELELFYSHLVGLANQIKGQKKVVDLKLKELEEKRKGVVEAYRATRIIETLKSRIHNGEGKKGELAEQKWVDFLFLSRKARQS